MSIMKKKFLTRRRGARGGEEKVFVQDAALEINKRGKYTRPLSLPLEFVGKGF